MPPSPSDVAYARVREICLRFPLADEKLSHGAPSFHVRGKMFLIFVDDHHDDGRLAVWCKSTLEDQRRLVAGNPARFFVPPYVGVKGWVGVMVAPSVADWIELSILVEHAWTSVAPPRALREGQLSAGAPPPRAPARVTTDAAVAREARERLSAICLALPEATCERSGRHVTYRVRKKTFAYFLDNHHGDGTIAACVKGDPREHARRVAAEPKRFFLPAYIGARGYLGIRLDLRRVDWKAVAERISAAHRLAAPKTLFKEGTPRAASGSRAEARQPAAKKA
ncbi:MAG TPA: MmcQ/YjbR family DNA-binding protein [Polyangiaceae bacterium]|jgi:hypothetical protein